VNVPVAGLKVGVATVGWMIYLAVAVVLSVIPALRALALRVVVEVSRNGFL
jgi:hypothetical protein